MGPQPIHCPGFATGRGPMGKKKSIADQYASVFETKKESQVRRERDAVLDEAAELADRTGCVWCDEPGNAHLHGAILFENGKALF